MNTHTPDAADALQTMASIAASMQRGHATGTAVLDTLGGLRLVEIATMQARRAVVAEARGQGATWQEIADTLGITRQAAHERFAR